VVSKAVRNVLKDHVPSFIVPEQRGTVIPQKIRNYSPNDDTSHPTRFESSAIPLFEHQILYINSVATPILQKKELEKTLILNGCMCSLQKKELEKTLILNGCMCSIYINKLCFCTLYVLPTMLFLTSCSYFILYYTEQSEHGSHM